LREKFNNFFKPDRREPLFLNPEQWRRQVKTVLGFQTRQSERGRMEIKFNLTGLGGIYAEAMKRSDPTLAFEVQQGHGRFVFLMFFSPEDKESKDKLFLQLRNTRVFLQLKAYGNHRKGDFLIYFSDAEQAAIREELQLGNGAPAFNFSNFLERINNQIPSSLPLQAKLEKIREVWPQVKNILNKVVDNANKTILMGIKRLPEGKSPRDKTLRKLYVYTNGRADVITSLISVLKMARVTLAWTDREEVEEKSLAEIMAMINA